ncbi:glycosyltransferase [Marinobacter sp. NSM]|uniref:glycosyltransferase n=1 Tax=Marinobacter sp. NSM TaxID=3458004 RepID=UPI004036CEFA
MKILLVITGLGVGGAERQVCDLADGLNSLGHEVRLLYLTGAAVVRPASPAVAVDGLGMGKNPLSFWGAVRTLKRHIESFRPDVVHSHMYHANIFVRFARLTCSMPRLISTAHNTSEGGRLCSFFYRVTDTLADLSTNVSDEAVEAFVENGAVPKGRMVVVYNGIDLSRFHGEVTERQVDTGDEFVLLAVGRLHPQKDYPNLLRAFCLLPRKHGDRELRLDIVGEGPERNKLEALARELKIESRVHFLGIRSDVPELLNRADLFVLSSAWEGFGLVVAEAMACEKRVVATDCGGVAEVLGGNGFLVPPSDHKALAEGIQKALAMSPNEAVRLGRAARDHIRSTFSLDVILSRWNEIYSAGVIPER